MPQLKQRGRHAPPPAEEEEQHPAGTPAAIVVQLKLDIEAEDEKIGTLEYRLEQAKLTRANLQGQLHIMMQVATSQQQQAANQAIFTNGSERDE